MNKFSFKCEACNEWDNIENKWSDKEVSYRVNTHGYYPLGYLKQLCEILDIKLKADIEWHESKAEVLEMILECSQAVQQVEKQFGTMIAGWKIPRYVWSLYTSEQRIKLLEDWVNGGCFIGSV